MEATVLAEWKRQLRNGGIRQFFENNFEKASHSTQDPSAPYGRARYRAILGDKELALEELEKACQARPFMMAWVKADPVFDCLRAEPRYQAILQRMGLS